MRSYRRDRRPRRSAENGTFSDFPKGNIKILACGDVICLANDRTVGDDGPYNRSCRKLQFTVGAGGGPFLDVRWFR